jgi:hypothetical protein
MIEAGAASKFLPGADYATPTGNCDGKIL